MPVYIASLVALLSGEETNAPYEKITEIETLDPLLNSVYLGKQIFTAYPGSGTV